MTISRYFRFFFLLTAAVAFSSCEDRLPYDDYVIGEGEANLDVTVAFHPIETALESRAAGNAVNSITSLWLVIYNVDAEGNTTFNDMILVSDDPRVTDYKVQTINTDTPSKPEEDYGDEPSGPNTDDPNVYEPSGDYDLTGEKTPKATFHLPNLPFGRYKMFAVANVPGLTRADCETVEKLLSKRFDWNTDVTKDNMMFGYLTPADEPKSSGFQPEQPIVVNRANTSLHAWIKRLVSKVTVSFDGSGLKENVRIYIKSVTIHDIPASCALGQVNKPDAKDQLIANGESFTYYKPGEEGTEFHEKWGIVLSKGSGPKGETGHTEADPALYFFENMQDDYEGQEKYLKTQFTTGVDQVGSSIDEPGTLPDGTANDYKDRVPYGSYIEVVAYYDSRNKEKISQGTIKYRFMLGKNITYNYDAERNYHYKLTLRFRGWANEADWHISYHEYSPYFITPEPYYISYLYGQKMEYPGRVILPPGANPANYFIQAEIVENNWWPWDRDHVNADGTKGARPTQFVPAASTSAAIAKSMKIFNGFAWNEPALSIYPYQQYTRAAYKKAGQEKFIYGGSNYVGFLSLQEITDETIGDDYSPKDTYGYGSNADTWLKNYYKEKQIPLQTYSLADKNFAKYDALDQSYSLTIPMWTRNKQMVNATDFTGNNPFNTYYRFAKVRLTLWEKYKENGVDKQRIVEFTDEHNKKDTERIATVYQVPRIENPKAIYRSHDKTDAFEVKLMLPSTVQSDGSIKYDTFLSDGPWKATILAQTDDFIQLTGPDNKTKSGTGAVIEGVTDTPVVFKYQPKSTIGSHSTRCGIIKVEYHDYNCVHLIFVRQGYHAPVRFGTNTNDAKWSCYNLYAARGGATNLSSYNYEGNVTSAVSILAASPLSIGSYFKRNQYNYAIREENNKTYPWMTNLGGLSTVYVTKGDIVTTRDNIAWGSIKGAGWDKYTEAWATTWSPLSSSSEYGNTFKVPTAQNFIRLQKTCSFGYGIAYADGSSTPATTIANAAGFTDYDNNGKDDAPAGGEARGVRVCVVYDDSGKNCLFPLSASGQGRRANGAPWGGPTTGTLWDPTSPWSGLGVGVLAYGGMSNVMGGDANMHRPLTYNLYRQAGAVYWMDKPNIIGNARNTSYASWDINYNTVRFNPYDYGSLGGNFGTASNVTDALPIKLVYK